MYVMLGSGSCSADVVASSLHPFDAMCAAGGHWCVRPLCLLPARHISCCLVRRTEPVLLCLACRPDGLVDAGWATCRGKRSINEDTW